MPYPLFDYNPGSFHTMNATPTLGGAGGLVGKSNTGIVPPKRIGPPKLAPVVNLNCMPGPGKKRDFRCGYCNQTINGKTYRCAY